MWLVDRVVDPKTIDAEVDARLRGSVAHQALYRFYSGLPKRLGIDQVDADRLDEALEFLRECLGEAIAGQVRIELSEVELLELEGGLARDLEQFVRQELELGFPLVPRRFEVAFGSASAPVELQRGLDLGGFTVSGKIDRIDVDPFSARGIVQDYKSGKTSHSAAQIESEGRLQVPLYVLALARSGRHRAARRPLPGARGLARGARARARGRRRPGGARSEAAPTTSPTRSSGAASRAPRSGRELGRGADPCGRREARPAARRVPDLVRPLADVPGAAGVSATPSRGQGANPEQARAIEESGSSSSPRAPGTGKTTVLVERFVQAVCERGLSVDSRPRDHLHGARGRRAPGSDPRPLRRARAARPRARGRPRLDLDHPRLLLAPPSQPSVRGRTRPALPGSRREPGARASRPRPSTPRSRSSVPGVIPTACGFSRRTAPTRLGRMLRGVFERLRSGGRPLVLEAGEGSRLAERVAELEETARITLAGRRA